MDSYQTRYGLLHGIGAYDLYPNGGLRECSLTERVELETSYGILIPLYDTSDPRKKNTYCLTLYKGGALRKIALNDKTIIETPLGNMEAELVTFYESGKIKKIFPLNGHLSAYWEENDEYQLAKDTSFHFQFGAFHTKIIAVSFYEDGSVKDITLWPKERIKLETILGECKTRIGCSLYPNGKLKSLEPALPLKISTKIGTFIAYDITANGITGEVNSLSFHMDGSVKSFLTSSQKVIVKDKEGKTMVYSPKQIVDIDGLEVAFFPLRIELKENSILFNDGAEYDYNQYSFSIEDYYMKGKSECANCSGCNGSCM